MLEMPEKFDGIKSDIEQLEENCVCEVDGFDSFGHSLIIRAPASANRNLFRYIQNSTSLKVSNAEINNSNGINLKLKPE